MSVLLIAGLLALCVGLMGLRTVEQQTVKVVETFGKYNRILSPGLNFIFFPIQLIAGTVSLKIESVQAVVEVKTADSMFVRLPVTLLVQVMADKANDAFYRLNDPHAQISSWVLNTVRATASGMKLEEMFSDRQKIVADVDSVLREKLAEFGYRIENVLVDQPSVTDDVQKAFNRVVAAQREAEAAKQEGEAYRIKTVAQATADAESQKLRAEGLANARIALAKGMKESLDQFDGVSHEIALDMLIQTNRIDALRDVGKHGNLILMDLNDGTGKALLPLLGELKKTTVA